ncbi:unnamed protein product [Tuber melanosporum]|uniref:(Perigord truffle) hypothetical protein n=1 Tax=Tuber melanosporum (strain Mel28) TaxID=656061 RepID=D5GGG0_TUBMM|nr:uncharacterized protein GSTUM_00007370001 [Tuber melanosporum]CAZ83603.1 unnamed protein product [Tuber melanosporum]
MYPRNKKRKEKKKSQPHKKNRQEGDEREKKKKERKEHSPDNVQLDRGRRAGAPIILFASHYVSFSRLQPGVHFVEPPTYLPTGIVSYSTGTHFVLSGERGSSNRPTGDTVGYEYS